MVVCPTTHKKCEFCVIKEKGIFSTVWACNCEGDCLEDCPKLSDCKTTEEVDE